MSNAELKTQPQAGCCEGKAKPDAVLEAGVESFPASDPPAWTAGHEERPASADVCCCGPSELDA